MSSVTAVQQHIINHREQETSSLFSIIQTNETTTMFNNSRRRIHTTISLLSSTTLPTSAINDELIYKTNTMEYNENDARNSAQLIIIIIVCSLMCILTIVGNIVVILAVSLVRRLRTASNSIIVSLAVSDLLIGLFIMPLAIILEISSYRWIFGSIMCDIWTSVDVLLYPSGVLHILVLSIDRYSIINYSSKYTSMRRIILVLLMIVSVWIVSAFVSLPLIMSWGCPSENLCICQLNPTLAYQIFVAMILFYIPVTIILIIYIKIYRTAIDHRSSVQMSQFVTHNTTSANVEQASEVVDEQQSTGNSCTSPQFLLNISNTNTNDGYSSTVDERQSLKRSENSQHESKSTSFLSRTRCLGHCISTLFNGCLSIFVSRRSSISHHVHLANRQAIRTLGVMLGLLIISFPPFSLFAIINPLHEHITGLTSTPKPLNMPSWVDPVLLWLGYSLSMLRPLIYFKYNQEFRTSFHEIICCRCKGLNDKIQQQEYVENLYEENQLQPATLPHITIPTRNSDNREEAI
ncbi:unnamed protein product [Rotaria sp. Silwood2]|nr:unnamed protein product [Rotaria sp. Silwood2]